MPLVKTAAIIGGGVIGSGWIARLIENGIHVNVFDPSEDARSQIEAVTENSRYAFEKLLTAPRMSEGLVSFSSSIEEAVSDASLIIESVPERLEIKRFVYQEIENAAKSNAVIASSTSGIMPTELQVEMRFPERFIVAHPFNPVYLIPLVEIVGGKETSAETLEWAIDFYQEIGMKPLHVKKEIEAFIADRLLEAIWREALWLVKDGVATTEDVDDAVRFGFGLRYAQMGIFDTYRVAGGEAGMRHFMAQFGPCLTWPWSKLTNVPEFNDELVELIASQSDKQSGHMSIREMERKRDENLISIILALKENHWGAGKTLREYEQGLINKSLSAANDE
ncbi:MAG: carnitine 3-dehydrogenase [Candidatus Azotimanducaceae bacterium]|jgi:carnitine 3-dehydrogenase